MHRHLRRLAITAACLVLVVLVTSVLPRLLKPAPPSPEQQRRDEEWVNTSPYWADRQACRWLGLCGLHHLRWDPPALENWDRSADDDGRLGTIELRSAGEADGNEDARPKRWETAGRTHRRARSQQKRALLKEIPDYVLAHAPLVHLSSDENFWPADIAEHIQHMTPYANGSALDESMPLSLRDVGKLNAQPSDVFLVSNENVEDRPEWLHHHGGIPAAFADDEDSAGHVVSDGTPPLSEGTTWYDVDRDHPLHRISDPHLVPGGGRRDASRGSRPGPLRRHGPDPGAPAPDAIRGSQPPPLASHHKPNASGYSAAPAILVLVDKGSGILDAFWFFFYSYNLGQTVLGVRYGNHVGDWEHCMVRFEDGVPRAMFLSEHEGGQAYAWAALEKHRPPGDGQDADARLGPPPPERPVIYSAVGSHAMYATPGDHPYVLPFKMLRDVSDRGPLWDPAENRLAYFYDYVSDRDREQQQQDGHGTNEEAVAVEEEEEEQPPATSLEPAASNPDAPTSWFHYAGRWGDDVLSLGDSRQWRLFGEYHYVAGPQGPKFKRLDRDKVCPQQRCRLLYSLEAGKRGTWYS